MASSVSQPLSSNYAKKNVRIMDLIPSQFSLGFQQVNHKANKMRKMTDEEFRTMLETKLVPVVKGPGGHYHILDHHHMCRALTKKAKTGDKHDDDPLSEHVNVEIRADMSGMKESAFWDWMQGKLPGVKKSVWPCDQHGEYVDDFQKKLRDMTVKDLVNDPYRSLAAVVRKAGNFSKSDKLFAEFQLANFFRSQLAMDRDDKLEKIDEKTVSDACAIAAGLSVEEKRVYGFLPSAEPVTPISPAPLTPAAAEED